MKSLLAVFLLAFLVSSCEKESVPAAFKATYNGTFTRLSKEGVDDKAPAQVTLSFTETAYSGTSNSTHYPEICNGKFSINQTTINVAPSCMFTANFDWTLIFSGDYSFELKGDSLHIWRTYSNGVMDSYKLAKAE